MKIFRPEYKGGVLYDTQTLRFKVVPRLCEPADIIMETPKNFPRSDILSAPVRAYFEVTRRCNLACKHCFVSSSPKAAVGASTNDLETVIDNLVRNRVIDVRFTGGEATTRPDWFELLQYAKIKGLQISLNTNGVYENPQETIKQIAELKLNQVTVSIDGNVESHDFMRGKGSYQRSVDAIKMMSECGIIVRMNCVVTQKNVKDIPEIVELASKYAHEVNFFHMRPVGRGINQNHLSLGFYEHFISAQETLALREKYPNLSIMHFEQSYRERSIRKSDSPDFDDSFSHGNTTINVDCFGGLWPNGYNTYQDKRLLLGNLVTDDLGFIWNRSPRLEGIRGWSKALLERCNGCKEYMEKCPGMSPEMEIGRINQGVINNFCINESPTPKLYGEYVNA